MHIMELMIRAASRVLEEHLNQLIRDGKISKDASVGFCYQAREFNGPVIPGFSLVQQESHTTTVMRPFTLLHCAQNNLLPEDANKTKNIKEARTSLLELHPTLERGTSIDEFMKLIARSYRARHGIPAITTSEHPNADSLSRKYARAYALTYITLIGNKPENPETGRREIELNNLENTTLSGRIEVEDSTHPHLLAVMINDRKKRTSLQNQRLLKQILLNVRNAIEANNPTIH